MGVALEEFAKYVRPEVPECPEIVILDAIRSAGRDFCKRTRLVRETLTVNTVSSQARYPLTTSTDTEPELVESVKRDALDALEPSSANEFTAWQLDTDEGQPTHYYLDGTDLVLGRIPNTAEALTVKVSLLPSDEAETLPDELARRYKRAIANGAKALLMGMESVPWTNQQAGLACAIRFDQAIYEANLRDAKGGTSRSLRVVGHFF